MSISKLRHFGLGIVMLMTSTFAAHATEIVYVPINPSFGGNPNNAGMLLNNAQAQNTYKAPVLSPQESFTRALQTAIQNRLLSAIVNAQLSDTKLDTSQPQNIDTPSFSVSIRPIPNSTSVEITTTDKSTGAVATVIVDQIQ